MDMNRRDFMWAAGAAAFALAGQAGPVETRNGMPYRVLGRTGEKVSLLGLGGNHLDGRRIDNQEAVRIIRTAIDEGINFLDNARSYNDGQGERNYGDALKDGYRDKVILMTKSRARIGADARRELEESLRNLGVDHIDVWQIHAIKPQPDIDDALAEDGPLAVAIRAREDGLIRYIGFSGHDYPEVHAEMIRRGHPWDTVQMPMSVLDYHWLSFQNEVLPLAIEHNIGVIAMKTMAAGQLRDVPGTTPEECLRYSMTLPISTLVCGMDSMEVLRLNLETARNFTPMTPEEMDALRARTREYGADGVLEQRFKARVPRG